MQEFCALILLACADAKTLRWRSATYVTGGNTKAVYGGINTKEVFAANGFDGPASQGDDDWDVLWTHRHQVSALSQLRIPYRLGRFLNHCEYFTGAGHKGQLAGHMEAALQEAGRTPYPEIRRLRQFQIRSTQGLSGWSQAVRELGNSQHWLIKPSTAGHSQGIEILDAEESARQSVRPQEAVAQEYLEDGLLLDNRKFHLRLYMFIPRWAPLSVYIFDDGVVFHSKHKYKNKRSVKEDVFSGVSPDVQVRALRDVLADVAKEGEAMLTCKADAAETGESCEAPSVTELRRRLRLLVEEALGDQSVLKKSFGKPEVTIPSKKGRAFGCFDLFGADVMFDRQLRPALLEINSGPNLWIDGEGKENIPLQRSIKGVLVDQIVGWLKGVVGRGPITREEAETLEESVLLNFTRVF